MFCFTRLFVRTGLLCISCVAGFNSGLCQSLDSADVTARNLGGNLIFKAARTPIPEGDLIPARADLNQWLTSYLENSFIEYTINGQAYSTSANHPGIYATVMHTQSGWKIQLENRSKDTLVVSNLLPFGRSTSHPYITGLGSHPLSRAHLFVPGRIPVNVILPDNAWELGYTSREWQGRGHVYGLARRDIESIRNGKRKRFETILYPGGQVAYRLYFDEYSGDWQEGLRAAFHDRKLHDLGSCPFDRSLFERSDLQWIRNAYVMHLIMAWDKEFYDPLTGKFRLTEFADRGKPLYGGDDVICIWPTWPTLGIDPRNQFDMYRDLPGGLPALRDLATELRTRGTKFFIAYNPWDESTRKEDHLKGLAELIKATGADGVVLDTRGESSSELQQAADAVKPGVIMYSEGMAVPRDMEGIVAGRVHNALYYPPMLNLNKLIMPEFAIFRVAEVNKEPIRREYATAFFNGYGTEINQFAPGHPSWEQEQYRYLGKTTRILRENSETFVNGKLTPLVRTSHDSIWVNRWEHRNKTLYTVFSLKPEGFNDILLNVPVDDNHHYVDLWNHVEVPVVDRGLEQGVRVRADAFNREWLGTNNEGEVTCIARLPRLLKTSMSNWTLHISAASGAYVRLTKGPPAYDNEGTKIAELSSEIDVRNQFGGAYEGKLVVQLFDKANELMDENVIDIKAGVPRLISVPARSASVERSSGMQKIPAGTFAFKATHGDEFISYPDETAKSVTVPSFFMDAYPVTNNQYAEFVRATQYKPSDTSNFLKHWVNGKPSKGEENYPVVYVSQRDAIAYATWARKRLPTELEWQYAAQTRAGNEWPWKQSRPVVRTEEVVNETLTVSSIHGIDPGMCNLGDGKLYPVGKFRKGVNPNGLYDLTGCVWQLTSDVYQSGSYTYVMMKGGSYYKPSSSWWYVQGGPRELHYRQYLLKVSEGFERNATVGFRCVRDAP